MKKQRKILCLFAFALIFSCIFAVLAFADSSTIITDAPLTAGRAFEDGEGIQLGKDLTEMPRTYEAVVYVPGDVMTKGAIISNYYPLGNTPHIDFSIGIGGTGNEARPMLDITDENDNRTRIEFRSNIKGDSWVHVVITHESNSAADVYTCYVNGEKVSRQNINYWINGVKTTDAAISYGVLDMSKMEQSASMYLGQAYGYSSTTELGADDPYNEGAAYQPTNFKGRIKNVALYSTVLTETQIKENYQSGINAQRDGVILCYDLSSKETSNETKSGYISDISGNGYDTVPLFHERNDELNENEFDYSFAILGDTQFLVDWDLKNGTAYSKDIYNWIIANKDAKKIARVLGVGDIVESGRLDSGVTDAAAREHAIAQWEYAVSEFAKLEAAGIPYTITWGYNHDGYYGEEFTTYFGNSANFTDSDIGYYFSDSSSADYRKRLANYYQRFEVDAKGENEGETVKIKYLVMCIEYRPSSSVLDWADAVIKANPDCKVIISTHYFLNQYGEISQEYSEIQPKWDKLANENANVEMIICGHVARQNNIVRAYTVAKSGQKVAQFLIDPQQMDRFYGYDDTGVVAMFYFSNGGNDVRVEFVSTARTMRAKATDSTAEDILYGVKNEFKFSFLEESENPDVTDPVEPETPDDIVTAYGTIPGAFASEKDYPFAIFDNNGKWVGAAKKMYGENPDTDGAMGIAKTYLKSNTWKDGSYGDKAVSVIILVRDDVVMDSGEDYYNIAQSKGSIIIDLDGHKLITPSDKNLFNLSHKAAPTSYGQTIFDTGLTIKNGIVVTTNKSVISFSTNANGNGKQYHCSFENVTFSVTGNASSLITSGTGTDYKFNPNVEFTDCVFDMSSAKTTVTLFNLGNATISVNYTVRGGSVTTVSDNLKLTAKSGECKGNLTFLASESTKEYTSVTVPSDVSITIDKFNNGTYYFAKQTGSDGDTATYVLYRTLGKYGSFEANSIEPYTFLIFDEDNNIVKYSDRFYGSASSTSAIHLAKELLKSNRWVQQSDGTYAYEGVNTGSNPLTYTIVLTRDYTMGADETYSNLSQIQGTLVIDLLGYTFSGSQSTNMFPTSLKKWDASGDALIFPSEIKIINGNIDVYNNAIIKYSLNSNGPGKSFAYTFENVNICVKGSAKSPIVEHPSATSNVYLTAVNLVNCNIDVTGSTASGLTLFNLGNKSTNTNISIYGGNIIVGDVSYAVSSKASGSGELKFEKYDSGVYTCVTVSCGSSVPRADEFAGGLAFVKIAENAESVVYMLTTTDVKNYIPRMSITLATQIKMNVYIPVESTERFTFNGKTYENLDELERVSVDGKEYYFVTVSLPSAESAKDIELAVSVNIDDVSAVVSFTFSTFKYAKKVLENAAATDIEKALVKDVIAYIQSAYNYFAEFNTPEEIARVNSIANELLLTGGEYIGEPELDGVTVDNENLISAVALNLDAKPSIRFYVEKDGIIFTLNGKKLDTVSGTDANGAYVELDVYAYVLSETITYTLGEESGSYHISDYLYKAMEDESVENYENLLNLVCCFIKYTESAAAYRNSVIGA